MQIKCGLTESFLDKYGAFSGQQPGGKYVVAFRTSDQEKWTIMASGDDEMNCRSFAQGAVAGMKLLAGQMQVPFGYGEV